MKRTVFLLSLTASLAAACSKAPETSVIADAADAVPDNSGFLFHLSSDLLQQAFRKSIDETQTINRCREACLRGSSTTTGSTTLEMTPSQDKANLDLVTSTVTDSRTNASADRATWTMTGRVGIGARTEIELTGAEGAKAYPTRSNANSSLQISNIDVDVRLFRRRALRRATSEIMSARGRMQAEMQNEAVSTLHNRLDAEAGDAVRNSDGLKKLEESRRFLRDESELGDRVRFSTTRLALRLAVDKPTEMEAGGARFTEGTDVGIRVHPKMIAEITEGSFSDQTMTRAEFEAKFASLFGGMTGGETTPEAEPENSEEETTPEAEPEDSEEETAPEAEAEDDSGEGGEPAITFRETKPVKMIIAGDLLTLRIRGGKWRTAERTYTKNMNVFVTYRLTSTATGPQLIKEGDVEVLPAGHEPGEAIPIRTQVIANAIKDGFAEGFKEELLPYEVALDGDLAGAGELRLRQLDLADGWLTIGYHAE